MRVCGRGPDKRVVPVQMKVRTLMKLSAEPRQAVSREVAGESEEQRNYRWAMAKEFGEACDGNRTSATTPNRSDVSNTNGTANATAPQDGDSAGAGDTTAAAHENSMRSTASVGTPSLATST